MNLNSPYLGKTLRALSMVTVLLLTARAEEQATTTAVYSKISNGYSRKKLPDGSFRRETYAISNGGYMPGAVKDASIDDVKFPVVAGVVGRYLASQNYFMAQDAKSADLLIIIRWGTSIPFSNGIYREGIDMLGSSMGAAAAATRDASSLGSAANGSATGALAEAAKAALEDELVAARMNNDARDRANEYNANLLGYLPELNATNDIARFAGAGTAFNDLIADLESERYFVIISAVDFRTAVQEKKWKLLWTTRISVQAQGTRFDEALSAMIMNASRHFGQDSGRLIRKFQYTPKVDLGELKVLAVVPDPASPPADSTEK